MKQPLTGKRIVMVQAMNDRDNNASTRKFCKRRVNRADRRQVRRVLKQEAA